MMRQLVFIFSLLFSLLASAQDTLVTKTKGRSGVELLFDLNSLMSYTVRTQNKFEGALSFRFQNGLRFEVEAGRSTLTPKYPFENGSYESNGSFYRVGLDYNRPLTTNSQLFFGLRYAVAMFDDTGQYTIGSVFWGDVTENFARQDLSAQWLEIILGSEAQLSANKSKFGNKVSIGWKLRIRKLVKYDSQNAPEVYSIPGYGRTVNNTAYGLNVHMRFMLFAP